MSLEGTGEMTQTHEFKRPVEQAPVIDKLQISRDFRDWVKFNSEPAEPQKLQAFKELTSEKRPFNVNDLKESKKSKEDKEGITEHNKEEKKVEEKILSILLKKKFRVGDKNLINQEFLLKKIKEMTADGKTPLEIVLPALPFKDPNPLATQHSPSEIDLGEYLVFSQLRDLCELIEEVYRPGAKITVIADGSVFSHLFGEGKIDEIKGYKKNCEKICEELNLQGKVEIKDMEDLLVGKKEQIAQTQKQIENILRESEQESKLENMESQVYMPMYKKEFRDAMESLQRSVLHLMPASKEDYNKYADYMSQPFKDLPEELRGQIHEKALQYASLYLAMGKLNIVSDAFPNALRATVHAKKDNKQIPLRLIPENVIFAWHGVPVISESKLEETKSFQESTRIERFFKVNEMKDVKAVYREGHESEGVFYYLIKDKKDKKE